MGDFEKDLQNAFEGAEFTPSPQVWEGVKAGLAPKKKVGILYMWQTYGVAAAILFLLTMGFLFRDGFFTASGAGDAGTELSQTPKTDSASDANKSGLEGAAKDKTAKIDTVNTDHLKDNTESVKSIIDNKQLQARETKTRNSADLTRKADSGNNAMAGVLPNADTPVNQSPEEQMLNQLQAANKVLQEEALSIYVLGPQDLRESMAALRLRWELENMVEPLKIDTANVIDPAEMLVARRTSLSGSFGGGNFNPNASSSTELALVGNLATDPLTGDFSLRSGEESEKQLSSLSIGGGIGFELGRKWILKTGLRYSQYRYASNSNAYSIEDGRTLPVYSNATAGLSQVRYAGEYELTNTIHSISVPVQMGYKLLDRNRFGVVINAGLGIDYFAKYTVKGDLNFLDTRSVDLGESDLLNRFNVNVLTGLELNYKLNEKFALSGEVFFRQYIPSLGETTGITTATPSFFGFGLGLNYYLKSKK